MKKLNNLKDLIMLLLYAPGASENQNEPISGQTRLMKMIFLFGEEVKSSFAKDGELAATVLPQFVAYDYGPYAPQVYADLEWLVNMGFVEPFETGSGEVQEEERREYDYWSATNTADDDIDIGQVGKSFKLTDRGMRFMKEKLPTWELTDNQMNILKEFKSRCVGASLRSLLHYVYSRYPKMTDKSKIKHEVLGS